MSMEVLDWRVYGSLTGDAAKARLAELDARLGVLTEQLAPVLPLYNEHEALSKEAARLRRRLRDDDLTARGVEGATTARLGGLLKRLGISDAGYSPTRGCYVTRPSGHDNASISAYVSDDHRRRQATDVDDERIAAALDAEGFTWTRGDRPHSFMVTEQKVKAERA